MSASKTPTPILHRKTIEQSELANIDSNTPISSDPTSLIYEPAQEIVQPKSNIPKLLFGGFIILLIILFTISIFFTDLCGGFNNQLFWQTVLASGTSTSLSQCTAQNLSQSLLLTIPWFLLNVISTFFVHRCMNKIF